MSACSTSRIPDGTSTRGITAGEYEAGAAGSGTSSYFHVPFLGLYGDVIGHGFFANVLARTDFWDGRISNSVAGLTDSKITGTGYAVTAETGYKYSFENGMFVTPSAGFSYNRATSQP